jgi:hypothetical protein
MLISDAAVYPAARAGGRLPPHAKYRLRGRLSDLESLKSGKDRTKNHWALFAWFACALERTKRDGFSPRAEPPPDSLS